MTSGPLCLRCMSIMQKADPNAVMYHGSIQHRSIGLWSQIDVWVCPKCNEITLKAVVV
jgi:hypothetical protein